MTRGLQGRLTRGVSLILYEFCTRKRAKTDLVDISNHKTP